MANNIVLVEDGHIISCVGIFPLEFICGDVVLSVGGIGGVSTDPQYRGRGLMTKLLNKAVSAMQEQNYDISILWGDRLRYNHFGWENAGRQYVFNIHRRHVLPTTAMRAAVRPLSTTGNDLKRIARLYEQMELRVHRTPEQFNSVFSRGTYETWIREKGEDFAYMTVRGAARDRELIEFGGDSGGLDELLSFLFAKYELDNLTAKLGVSPGPYIPFLVARSSDWSVRFIGMVKILNLSSVLKKFARQIEKKCHGLGLKGSLTLEMTSGSSEAVGCASGGSPPTCAQFATLKFADGVKVTDRRAEPVLSLSDTEMVRLIFGTVAPSHSLHLDQSLAYLDAIFPLDFYVPRLNYV